jgi:PPM family protein phosphatase
VSLRLRVGAVTDVGRVRGHNEDAFLVDDELGLIAVADGMGGHQAGEVASATALEALRAAVTSGEPIRDAVHLANHAVYDKSTTDDRLHGMGTTLTAGTLAAGGTLLLGHVGDSRAYLLRDGELRRVTTDHSLVEELIQAGEITAAEAESDPRRSMITRTIGVEPEVEVDVYPLQLARGDRLLICSDGLTGMVAEDDISTVLQDEADPTAAAHALVTLANEGGGIDNITVLVVDAVDDDSLTDTIPIPPDEAAPEEPASEAGEREAAAEPVPRPRRRLLRVLRWALPIVAVLGAGFGYLGWYARHHYFVKARGGVVAIYQGRPGGVLFWQPTLQRQDSDLRVSDLTDQERRQVADHHGADTLSGAQSFVDQLQAHALTSPPTGSGSPRGGLSPQTIPPLRP